MNSVVLIVVRAVAGGALVVVFSLVAEVFSPKAFSGLFSAAPSVASASLALTVGFESVAKARAESAGMILGGVGMAAACIVSAAAIPRASMVVTSLGACVGWGAVAIGLYWGVFAGVS